MTWELPAIYTLITTLGSRRIDGLYYIDPLIHLKVTKRGSWNISLTGTAFFTSGKNVLTEKWIKCLSQSHLYVKFPVRCFSWMIKVVSIMLQREHTHSRAGFILRCAYSIKFYMLYFYFQFMWAYLYLSNFKLLLGKWD
jgi:hypothetical protein